LFYPSSAKKKPIKIESSVEILSQTGGNQELMNNCLSPSGATKNSRTTPCYRLQQPKIHEQLFPAIGSNQKFMNNSFPLKKRGQNHASTVKYD
jgi:hypothetical protein